MKTNIPPTDQFNIHVSFPAEEIMEKERKRRNPVFSPNIEKRGIVGNKQFKYRSSRTMKKTDNIRSRYIV